MPNFNSGFSERLFKERAKTVRAKLIARGLNPRGLGFMRAYNKAMRK